MGGERTVVHCLAYRSESCRRKRSHASLPKMMGVVGLRRTSALPVGRDVAARTEIWLLCDRITHSDGHWDVTVCARMTAIV